MAFINVDRARLDKAATAIDSYVKKHKSKMGLAGMKVQMLTTGAWRGLDSNQFKAQWSKVTQGGSTSDKMISSLENYSSFLKNASRRYGVAQFNAINRARGI
jgi:hypothetical protein